MSKDKEEKAKFDQKRAIDDVSDPDHHSDRIHPVKNDGKMVNRWEFVQNILRKKKALYQIIHAQELRRDTKMVK